MEAIDKQLTFYNKGTRAWIQDDVEGFVSGTVVSNDVSGNSCTLVFEVEGRDEPYSVTITKGDADINEKLPPLRNPPVLEGVDDLTLLSHLNEPEVLHNVKLRYAQEQIYTYSGIVLIALNPFQRLPIYTHDIMRAYSGKRRGELEPHLFAVAEEAYRNMLMEKKNQSIIVSGESGAGKTQSAKYIMRYFASVDELDNSYNGSDDIDSGGMSEVEEAVLATNPIMEAFGNAKTTRNDNSSRFGKYIEIQFHKDESTGRVKICGAKTRTYLLERSRLVFQPKTERNYHIFYQLCSGCPAAERKELGITTFDQYHYLRQGGEGVIPNVDDVEEFEITQRALSAIGISVNMQWAIFKVCAALLHIGNIEVKESRNGDAQINTSDEALEIASRLLGVKSIEFSKWMVKKQIHARSETIVTNLKKYDAIVSRDSVAKFIYSLLFDWLVKMINKNLAVDETKYPADTISFIGVLDIYGFEHFKNNSFEQFCINYANEKLQQEFNRHVFKLEQDEYIAEKIEWSFIDFNDNQPCIDMIENRLGILSLLDEESRLPSGSDNSLVQKLYANFDGKHKFFKKPRFARSDFTICHYALDVTYQIEGFIEKNKDTVSDELLNLLQNSESEFIRELTTLPKPKEDTPPPPTRPGFKSKSKNTKNTLGSIFKASLIELMNTIRSTDSHYIRCIKPNQAKVAFEFEPQMVLSQLRACGVLETIRISCAGYPTRWTFQEFVERYYLLVHSKNWKHDDPREFSLNIVKLLISDKDKYQVGETKIFFRAGMLAYFEKLRTERLRQCVVLVQKNARRFVYHRRYLETKEAALFVQKSIRRKIAQLKCRGIRETNASITIQKYARRYIARKNYLQQRESAIAIQTQIRGYIARKQLNNLRREKAAIKIQKVFRGQRERHKYQANRKNIIFIQSCIRRIFAQKEFTKLKIEAKSVAHIKKLNYQLENKVFELSQSLAQKENESKEYVKKIETMESQIKIWKEKFDRLDNRFKDSAEQASEGNAEQAREISELKETKTNLESTIEKMKSESKKALAEKDKRIAELEKQLEKQKEEFKNQRSEVSTRRGQVVDENSASIIAQLKRENASLKDQLQKAISGKDYLYDADERVGRSSSVSRVRGRSSNRNKSRIPSVDTRTTMLNVVDRPVRQLSRVRNESEGPSKPESQAEVEAPVVDAPTKEQEAQSLEDECSLKILEDESLEQEIIDGLIMNLKIPLPNSTQKIERKDILFPAHIIGTCMLKLMKHGLLARLQTLSSKVIAAIQNVALRFEDDYISCFWLSNTYELSCVVETIRTKEASRSRSRYRMESDGNKVLIKILNDLDNLLVRLYYGWMKELKKRLAVMAVPAIIEYQALPSFICKKNGGLWNKIKAPQNSYTIDHLLFLLSKISKVLICFYVEESIARQILCELIRLLGVTAFNHLIMRKNFCTWKRGMQIQYNLSKLEEWCDEHQIPEGALHLERLLQAAKLLQLNKSSPRDIEIIFDICFLLNPSQIKKFLSLYYPVDFENPVSPELLKSVSFRTISENNDTLLLDMDDVEFDKPPLRTVDKIDTSGMPAWADLFLIKCLLELN